MFYTERKRRQEIAKQEAAGANVWSTDIPSAFRVKLQNLGDRFNREANDMPGASYVRRTIYEAAQKLLTADLGVSTLANIGNSNSDFHTYMHRCDSEEFPNVLEAMYAGIDALDQLARAEPLCVAFEKKVNTLLDDYRIAYSMHQGEVIPFTSREIHSEVTLPALQLLTNPVWAKVEASYQDALHEVSNKPGDAVTSATTALQDGLKILGCTGKDLKTLLISAKKTILKGEDQKLIDAIDHLIKWASAARVNDGDVHTRSQTNKDRAWLVIHMVGILLLYLSNLSTETA